MTMIRYHDVVPLLVEAVPSFRPQWEVFQTEAKATGDEILPYIVVGALARHLHKLARTGETGEFAALFDVIERVLLEGEHSAAELAHIGMLECLKTCIIPPIQRETLSYSSLGFALNRLGLGKQYATSIT